jgi:hypothetical protein
MMKGLSVVALISSALSLGCATERGAATRVENIPVLLANAGDRSPVFFHGSESQRLYNIDSFIAFDYASPSPNGDPQQISGINAFGAPGMYSSDAEFAGALLKFLANRPGWIVVSGVDNRRTRYSTAINLNRVYSALWLANAGELKLVFQGKDRPTTYVGKAAADLWKQIEAQAQELSK